MTAPTWSRVDCSWKGEYLGGPPSPRPEFWLRMCPPGSADGGQPTHSQGRSFMTRNVWFVTVAAAMHVAISVGAEQATAPENAVVPEMPLQSTRVGTRVNRVIDMWLKGQPVYYTQVSGGGYEQGKTLAATKADYITYEM